MADHNPGYPPIMQAIESRLLAIRRSGKVEAGDQAQPEVLKNAVGIGLSGGGIRSATFCLGLFQGLVNQKLARQSGNGGKTLLSKIDYMSTVSGGGYFGAFYGRLFTRPIETFKDVEDILDEKQARDQIPADNQFPKSKVFRWLRENGRYLAPNGSGDLLLGGAVFVRNWVAVQLVWGTFVLMLFLLAQFLRGVIEVHVFKSNWLKPAKDFYGYFLSHQMPWASSYLWWSPYTILVGVIFLFMVIPPAWSYWLVEKPNPESAGHWIPPLVGVTVLLLLAVGVCYWAYRADPPQATLMWCCIVVIVVSLETEVWTLVNRRLATRHIAASSGGEETLPIDRDEQTRNQVSRQLKTALVVMGVVLAFVLIDTLAQTGYGAWLKQELHVKRWVTALLAPLLGLVGLGRTIFSSVASGGSAGKKVSLPIAMLAGVAAVIVGVLVLTALDFGAYAIAWNRQMPRGASAAWTTPQKLTEATTITATRENKGWTISPKMEPPTTPDKGLRSTYGDLKLIAIALPVALIFSFLFGWSWPFLNRSTYHPIYTARLIRAYLGASNPERLKRANRDVTETVEGDDIRQENYWPRFVWLEKTSQPISPETIDAVLANDNIELRKEERDLFAKGMPIHLVNVTINETVDAASKVEQHDRKGTGMAVGPAGLSVGIKHHLVLKGEDDIKVYPPGEAGPPGDYSYPYRVFDFRNSQRNPKPSLRRPERLTLGNWTGISGAAFSTSLGWRTSPSLSLLAGLANVRLSYWWNSGTINIRDKGISGWISAAFQGIFSVQDFLFGEFLARFHGTLRQFWPLSDGGHFENMGGYELIRRRLPLIIIVDAEADPEYTFEGLANLVRKARLDFGAEIRFLNNEQLEKRVNVGIRKYFGTLDQLRRGKWVEEPVLDPIVAPREKRRSIGEVDQEALSLAHAALADVFYDSGDRSLLLYIKPTLIGDEPADVRRYHSEHPSFPHESTADQFFDEAQWESYRRLGEHIANKIFSSRDDKGDPIPEASGQASQTEAGKFLPYLMHA